MVGWGGAKLPCRAAWEWTIHVWQWKVHDEQWWCLLQMESHQACLFKFVSSILLPCLWVPKVVIPRNRVAGDGRSPHLVPCTNRSSRPYPQWATPQQIAREDVFVFIVIAFSFQWFRLSETFPSTNSEMPEHATDDTPQLCLEGFQDTANPNLSPPFASK